MSDTLLLDTDVASYLFKNSPRARPFRPLLHDKHPTLAFISVAELFKWAFKQRWGRQKVEQLESALRSYVVVPYDRDLAWAWARIVAACEDAGRPIAPSDAWVAAAALRHDIPLMTNNLKHYEAAESLCGLKLVRPQST
jgi:tRNA(fMet)-specific endonuclease VapC